MNIKSPSLNSTTKTSSNIKSAQETKADSSAKFSEELEELKKADTEKSTSKVTEEEKDISKTNTTKEKTEAGKENKKETQDLKEIDKSLEELNLVVKELNQTEDKAVNVLKDDKQTSDNNFMINNDFNIQENKDLLPQMNPNMNFSGDGQAFSSFMNNNAPNQNNNLNSSEQDLAEENAILSTMAENIAMANKNSINDKTVVREEGIKKVNTKTGITTENIVKFDSILMNQADVEVFANIVNNGNADMNNLAPQAAQKSIQVSKTLSDMLAKSMENNQPLRIDFDNNISVIIRISRDGKISADFLPSTQVAEAYLKENLPLLKQRFDENNINYDELNQRERREQNRDRNQKKGRENE